MQVKLPGVRIAFAQLFTPKAGQEGGKAKYSAAFILDPKAPYIKDIESAITAVAKAKWGEKAPGVLKKLTEEGRICFKKGPRTKDDGTPYEGFDGMYSINASNEARPTVIDRDKTPLTAGDGKPYSGCYVNAIITVWAMDNQYGRRINATLGGVQFVKDGDAFGGGATVSADAFETLDADADDLVGA